MSNFGISISTVKGEDVTISIPNSPNTPNTLEDIKVNTCIVKPVEVDNPNNLYIFQCPHCEAYVQVEQNQVNCTIFRHGYFYETDGAGNIHLTMQVNPHAPKEECDKLVAEGKVQGCCKPFRMVKNGDSYVVTVCDYI